MYQRIKLEDFGCIIKSAYYEVSLKKPPLMGMFESTLLKLHNFQGIILTSKALVQLATNYVVFQHIPNP